MTGKELTETYVQDLERRGKLDRHHVFPRNYLKGHVEPEQINHCLNGVLLSKDGNLSLGSRSPDLYLRRILKSSHGLEEDWLRDRVNSHLVPYDTLMSEGTPKVRFTNFIKRRATLLAREIEALVKP